jgi:hypothetical protein
MKKINLLAVGAILCAFYFGCSIHQQSPIKEVAYDFSDYYTYDRGYATSPQYPIDAGVNVKDASVDAGNKSDNPTKIKVEVIVESVK